jgi:hypothetical protein
MVMKNLRRRRRRKDLGWAQQCHIWGLPVEIWENRYYVCNARELRNYAI